MPQTTNEVENRGEEGNSPQGEVQESSTQPQSDTTSTTLAITQQTTKRKDNATTRLKENNEQNGPQGTGTLLEKVKEQAEQALQNQMEGSLGGPFENNKQNSENPNSNEN